MAQIDWNEGFHVGVASIDAQHRELAEAVNQIDRQLAAGISLAEVQELFDLFTVSAARHFRHEEELFGRGAFPGAGSHKLEHGRLLLILTRFRQSLDAEQLAATAAEHVRFLSGWLIRHIVTEDRPLGVHLNNMGIR